MPQPGERAVVVVNHVSFLDGLLLAAFLPGKPTFAIHSRIAQSWWVAPVLKLFRAFPVDPTNPMAAKAMVKAVREGRTLVIFPEGRITVTGALMKVFDGPGMVADKADAPIVPVRIDGAAIHALLAPARQGAPARFPKIRLTILPPRRFAIEGEMSARERRAIAGRRLYDVMSEMIFATSNLDRTLFDALLDARRHPRRQGAGGRGRQARADEPRPADRSPPSCSAAPSRGGTRPGEAVGLLLPNVTGVAAAFFALQAIGRVPAMLNYTAGLANLKAACTAAEIRTIVTARAFVEQAKLGEPIVDGLEAEGCAILYLEDIGAGIGLGAKLARLARRPLRPRRSDGISPDAPAVILFTAGSEGAAQGRGAHPPQPARQLPPARRADRFQRVRHRPQRAAGLPQLRPHRRDPAADPQRHQDPALSEPAPLPDRPGARLRCQRHHPVRHRHLPRRLCARMAHGYDFYSLRYIFAGAERVREETRRTYAEKFGLRILEGYGATEAGPVIAVNTPMHYLRGQRRPAAARRRDAARAGARHRRGRPAVDPRPQHHGRLSQGRRARHPAAARGAAGTIPATSSPSTRTASSPSAAAPSASPRSAARWSRCPRSRAMPRRCGREADHAVVTRARSAQGRAARPVHHRRKAPSAAALQAWGRANGVTELAIPRDIRVLEALPVLGTGKIDYVALGELATGKEPARRAAERVAA